MEPFDKLMEIVKRISDLNNTGKENQIPRSDQFYLKVCSDIVDSPEELADSIEMLNDAHYIFLLKIVEPDDALMISGINGYIATEISILAKLKTSSFQELEKIYASQFYKQKQASVILREAITDVRKYNNTPFGKALNTALMVEQYEHYMATSYNEFTDTWKENRLTEILSRSSKQTAVKEVPEEQTAGGLPGSGLEPSYDSNKRAADSEFSQKIETMDRSGKWGEAVSKYGVEFLLRIHFRKYEFEKVKSLIKSNRITLEKDLRYIRDTIKLMETRLDKDPELGKYLQTMQDLRRTAQLRLNKTILAKKARLDN